MTDAVQHFINGREVPSRSGRTFETLEPSTGNVLANVAFGTEEDVADAVDSAARAFDEGVWRNLAPGERARRLRKVAALIADHADDIASIESRDSGKPVADARADVSGAVSLLEFASTLPESVHGRVYSDEAGHFTYSRRIPYGVVGAIAPWNFPFLLAVWKTAPALATGNSVVLKMAEQTPLSTAMFARLCLEGGIPPGVLNVVHGDGPTTGAALVRHPKVPKITFTGSTSVGREILIAAAADVKSCHLELGGKSPNIVFADSDLEQAMEGSLFTSFFNSGQICTAGTRLLIDERVADEFLDGFVRRAAALRVGDPASAETQMGPVVSVEQRERIRGYVRLGVEEGATVATGGGSPEFDGALRNGYFLQPTVFTDVTSDMRIANEEIFGPVLSVLRFRGEQECVAIANSVMYGLAATIWTNRLDTAFEMAEKLDAGIIWTNCPNRLLWHVPYEGQKASGLGEDLGHEAADTFTRLRVNYVNFAGTKLSWA